MIRHCQHLVRPLIVLAAGSAPAMADSVFDVQTDGTRLGFGDYEVCVPGTISIPEILLKAVPEPVDEQPVHIAADKIDFEGRDIAVFAGSAQIVQGNRAVFADHIEYNQQTYQADVNGNVTLYTSDGDEIKADTLQMQTDTFIGKAENVRINFVDKSPYFTQREHYGFLEDYSPLAPFRNKTESPEPVHPQKPGETYVQRRSHAEKIDFQGRDFQRLHQATLTTCTQGKEDVKLSAKQIELDHDSGIGTAKHMIVRFKNVPIFYFPRVSFPINDERKTGFLFPGIGYQEASGGILEIPYYINIAGNQDATVIPRILGKRGVQLYGEYRYLTKHSNGIIRGEVLPSDDVFGDDRHAFSYAHDHRFGNKNRWRASIDFQDVSDTRYLRDFNSDVDVTASVYVPQRGELSYDGRLLRMRVRATAYQRVNESGSVSGQPYERLPQATLDIREQSTASGFKYGFNSELTQFVHDDQTRVDGIRLRLKPYISYPVKRIYGHITPKLSVQTISYTLQNNPFGDTSPSVAVPIASIDSGLVFERFIGRPDRKTYLQTLEPRLFYLHVPEKTEQEEFPDFDTGTGSSGSFSQLFREHRFFGGDRVGDTHQISAGLTSRIIDDDTGEERFRISLGQIFYLDDREVGLTPGSVTEDSNRSDFLAEMSASVNPDWRLTGSARWTAENYDFEFLGLSARYHHSDRRNASIGYSISRNEQRTTQSEQLNLRFDIPLGARWQFSGRANYSIKDSELRTSEMGIAYDGCCWAASLRVQQILRSAGEYENRYTIAFELDDLGKISSGL